MRFATFVLLMGHDHNLSGNFERQILFFMCCSQDCLTRMLYVKLKARYMYTEPTLFSCVKKFVPCICFHPCCQHRDHAPHCINRLSM